MAPGVSRYGRETTDPGDRFDNNVYTSYPLFNYHESLVDDLIKSGFDVVSTANNHALDRGPLGVQKTIEILRQKKLAFTGTKTIGEARGGEGLWYTIVEKKGFRTAWLACTFSTNGIPDRYNQVLDCFNDRALIVRTIRELSEDRSVDGIVITPHVGVEYEDVPRGNAVQLYRSFLEAGAIAVFGSHPHVLQPWEKFITKDGREGLIIYSLGNFVSGQFHKVKTRATLLLQVQFGRDRHGRMQIEGVQYLPLGMVRTSQGYTLEILDRNSGYQELYHHITGMFGTLNLIGNDSRLR